MKFTEKYNLPETIKSADTRKVVTFMPFILPMTICF